MTPAELRAHIRAHYPRGEKHINARQFLTDFNVLSVLTNSDILTLDRLNHWLLGTSEIPATWAGKPMVEFLEWAATLHGDVARIVRVDVAMTEDEYQAVLADASEVKLTADEEEYLAEKLSEIIAEAKQRRSTPALTKSVSA